MTRPGEIEFTIKLSGRDALDFVPAFAKALLLDVIADDRAAHEGPAPGLECRA